MNHGNALRKFSRTSSHRRAMFRNLATNLILLDSIKTTLPKAKELKRIADKLVTLGKKNSLQARRQAMKYLMAINREEEGDNQKWTSVHKLFTDIAPRFAGRNGGYTRIIKIGPRLGDKAPMALIQFVESEVEEKKETKKRRVTRKAKAETATAEQAA